MAHTFHGTLTPSTVVTHTLNTFTAQVTVLNRSQTGEIYFTVDGSTPTVGGSDCYACLGSRAVASASATAAPVVKLISSGALAYTVTGETA